MDAVTVTADSGTDLECLLTCEPLLGSIDRLIVVDNASTDGSGELARRAGAVVLRRDRREGYARCVNLAVRHTQGPSFAVLNPDICFPDERSLADLERHFDDDPALGVVAPALVLPNGRLQDSARQIPTPLDLAFRRCFSPRRGAIDASGEVPWVVGACFLARREAWEAVGGLDERYFLYFEDVDLGWRLRQAGWTTRLDRDVRVQHRHAAASRKSLLEWATRRHVASAARFYRNNPRFIYSGQVPEVGVRQAGHPRRLVTEGEAGGSLPVPPPQVPAPQVPAPQVPTPQVPARAATVGRQATGWLATAEPPTPTATTLPAEDRQSDTASRWLLRPAESAMFQAAAPIQDATRWLVSDGPAPTPRDHSRDGWLPARESLST
jgi:GT2 family glycosyltransferase